MNNSDFPEFDQAYQTVLVKDLEDKFEQLAAAANFNIYHSDIWRGTARLFAESIVRECAKAADEGLAEVTMKGPEWPSYYIKKHFGVDTKHES